MKSNEHIFQIQLNHYAEIKIAEFITDIGKYPFLWVDKKKYLLDTQKNFLWDASEPEGDHLNVDDVKDVILGASLNKLGGHGWVLPTVGQLFAFAQASNNPIRTGAQYRLFDCSYWLAEENGNVVGIDLDSGYSSSRRLDGHSIVLNPSLAKDLKGFVSYLAENNLTLSTPAEPDKNLLLDLKLDSVFSLYEQIDYNRCRLPKLERNQITDTTKGLWELNDISSETLSSQKYIARDPKKDVRSGNIGIDFGTSSTVVAYEDVSGRPKLLRIGVNDFFEEVLPEHYENPTVLEFVDFQVMLQQWQAVAQQPMVSWDTVRCSHEALHGFRNNDSNPKIVASVLSKIKQWALREANHDAVRITDQLHQFEHTLAHLSPSNPVKGKALTVNDGDAFDPVELYAWFLGLNINWRSRGLFLKYYMTFPVAYPVDVKEKILASFRRGLWRSLPETLVQDTALMEGFVVEERASEPAAYAASAMLAHKIEPTPEGVAYAVFDFGGGTTDFDFGYYRLATEAEENRGIEEVFEHFESAGDKFLGGENLLENMAYLVFQHNLDKCREHRIAFTKPLDAEGFGGSEVLIDETQIARTNTLMLMSQLRPCWEQGRFPESGVIALDLLKRDGDKVKVELVVKKDVLSDYLDNRIQQGVRSFFTAMKNAFGENLPRQVNILLAGNSSRSKRVSDAFGLVVDGADEMSVSRAELTQGIIEEVFKDRNPEFISYAPLLADPNNESVPTAKTGVALGILRLCPGSSTSTINRTISASAGEAPFAFYVGRSVRGQFVPSMKRNDAYEQWKKIGIVTDDGVFNLFYTQSNQENMQIGHAELTKQRLDFTPDNIHHTIYARPKSPASIEIVTVLDEAQLDDIDVLSAREVLLA